MATETDAARDRVLAARATLGEEIETLEASVRAAVDVPARIRRSPAKAAAIVGSVGFVAVGGPRRLFGAVRRRVTGAPPPLPKSMLPDEIERTLRKMGSDGDKIRGTLERDFAAYARQNRRQALNSVLLATVARPLLTRGAKAATEWFLRPDAEGFQARLDQVRARTTQGAGRGPGDAVEPPPDEPVTAPTDDEASAAGA